MTKTAIIFAMIKVEFQFNVERILMSRLLRGIAINSDSVLNKIMGISSYFGHKINKNFEIKSEFIENT